MEQLQSSSHVDFSVTSVLGRPRPSRTQTSRKWGALLASGYELSQVRWSGFTFFETGARLESPARSRRLSSRVSCPGGCYSKSALLLPCRLGFSPSL